MAAPTVPARAALDSASRGRRIGFRVATLLTLALVVFGLGEILFYGIVGWMPLSTLDRFFPGELIHRFHGLGHSLVSWLLLAAVAVQLWRPERRYAPALYALIVLSLYTIMDVVAAMFDPLEAVGIALLGVMVWLHPGRDAGAVTPLTTRALVWSAPVVIGGVAVAVIGLVDQVRAPVGEPHAVIGHYGDMAALGLAIAFAALLGATSLVGSRIVAGLTVLASIYIGIASIVYAGYSSSPGATWGVLTLLAAAVYAWAALPPRGAGRAATAERF